MNCNLKKTTENSKTREKSYDLKSNSDQSCLNDMAYKPANPLR